MICILERFLSSGTLLHTPADSLNGTATKNQTLPDNIKFIVFKFRDESWQRARGLVLLSQHEISLITRVVQTVRAQAIGALRYKATGRGINSRCCHAYFSLTW